MLAKIKFTILKLLSYLRKKFLGKYAISITYNTVNGFFSIPIEDFSIGRKLGFEGQWNRDEVDKLSQILSPENTVYILGTHVGTLLIPLSRKCKEVIGFEANPAIFGYLKNNIYLNNIENSRVYNYGVGDQYGQLHFLQNSINSGGSKILPQKNDYAFTYDNPSTVVVDMVPLDDFIEKNNLPSGDVLIMDIEGSEFMALKGMAKSIEHCRNLYIEFEPVHLKFVANCALEEFLNLFIHRFSLITFMRRGITIDLINDFDQFNQLILSLYQNNQSDDLLLVKNK